MSKSKRILIIEDESSIRRLVVLATEAAAIARVARVPRDAAWSKKR